MATENLQHGSPEYFQEAISMSVVLTHVVEREVVYKNILDRVRNRRAVPEYLHNQQQMLAWAEGVYRREITEMGYEQMAEDAMVLGYDAAMEKFKNKR